MIQQHQVGNLATHKRIKIIKTKIIGEKCQRIEIEDLQLKSVIGISKMKKMILAVSFIIIYAFVKISV